MEFCLDKADFLYSRSQIVLLVEFWRIVEVYVFEYLKYFFDIEETKSARFRCSKISAGSFRKFNF